MRTAVAIIFFLGFFSRAQAQDEYLKKGLWMIGGNGEIYMEKISSQTGRLIAIVEPQIGYFLSPSWAVGFRGQFAYLSTEYRFGLQPFVRYYISLKSNVQPFFEANIGTEFRYVRDVSNEYSVTKNFVFGGRGGAAVFIRENISFDVFLYYTNSTGGTTYPNGTTYDPTTNQYLGVGAGFQIYL